MSAILKVVENSSVLPAEAYKSNELLKGNSYCPPINPGYIKKIERGIDSVAPIAFGVSSISSIFTLAFISAVLNGWSYEATPETALVFLAIPITGITTWLSCAIANMRVNKKIELIYSISNVALIKWMKEEYNLDITWEEADIINVKYFKEFNTYGSLASSTFKDVEKNLYIITPDPNDYSALTVVDKTSGKVLTSSKSLLKKKLENANSKDFNFLALIEGFTKKEIKLFMLIESHLKLLKQYKLNVEDNYVFNRIQNDFVDVLELNRKAKELKSYEHSQVSLERLLDKIEGDLKILLSKQSKDVAGELNAQYAYMLER
jgi:hypothetical protein